MKKIAIAALLSAITVAPAFAADEGFYAGVTLGQARTNAFAAAMTKSNDTCLLYTSPSPRDGLLSRMPSSA